MRLRRSALLAAALSPAFGACVHGRRPASYLPAGAPAQYGDRTQDGVVLLLRAAEADVRAAVARGLAANGYVTRSAGPAGRVLETAARALGGDTTLAVHAEVTPEDPSGGGVVVVITGRYSVPSARIRDAQVVQRPGERNALYARLRAVADSARADPSRLRPDVRWSCPDPPGPPAPFGTFAPRRCRPAPPGSATPAFGAAF